MEPPHCLEINMSAAERGLRTGSRGKRATGYGIETQTVRMGEMRNGMPKQTLPGFRVCCCCRTPCHSDVRGRWHWNVLRDWTPRSPCASFQGQASRRG